MCLISNLRKDGGVKIARKYIDNVCKKSSKGIITIEREMDANTTKHLKGWIWSEIRRDNKYMWVNKSIYQIKQHMIMNINFAIYFTVISVLKSLGDDQILGLKLVSDEVNQVCPLLFYFWWMHPDIILSKNYCYCFCAPWSILQKCFWIDDEVLCRDRSKRLILLRLAWNFWCLEVPITSYCENSRMRLAWYHGNYLKHRHSAKKEALWDTVSGGVFSESLETGAIKNKRE